METARNCFSFTVYQPPGKEDDSPAPRLKSLFVYVTDRCNLRCRHCYYTDTGSGDFPPDILRGMIDEAVDMGAMNITLSGGEVLLCPPASKTCSMPRVPVRPSPFLPTVPSVGYFSLRSSQYSCPDQRGSFPEGDP